MIAFIEGCLREKETVEVEKDGKIVVDRERSRFSWEEVYLHPLFEGELTHIPRQVAGRDILLTIKTYAKSNEADANDLFEGLVKEKGSTVGKEEFRKMLRSNNMLIPDDDVDLLQRMFSSGDGFEMNALIE